MCEEYFSCIPRGVEDFEIGYARWPSIYSLQPDEKSICEQSLNAKGIRLLAQVRQTIEDSFIKGHIHDAVMHWTDDTIYRRYVQGKTHDDQSITTSEVQICIKTDAPHRFFIYTVSGSVYCVTFL